MILSSALAVAFFALTPLALGEPADEQYNFNPPNPGGNGGESGSGSSGSSGLPGSGSNGQGPGGLNALFAGGKDGEGAGGGEGGSEFATPTGLTQDSGTASPDRSALSAVTDSLGLGLMPIVIAAIAAIGVGGASIALWRRRGRQVQGEPA